MWTILDAAQYLLNMIYLSVDQKLKSAPNISTGCSSEINVLEYFNVVSMLARFADIWCSQRLLH